MDGHTVWRTPVGGGDSAAADAALHALAAIIGRRIARKQLQRRSRGKSMIEIALLLGMVSTLLALALAFLS